MTSFWGRVRLSIPATVFVAIVAVSFTGLSAAATQPIASEGPTAPTPGQRTAELLVSAQSEGGRAAVEARQRAATDRRVLESRLVAIDFEALGGTHFDPSVARVRFAQSVSLALPGGSVTAIQERVDLNPMGGYSWIGRLADDPESSVTLAVNTGTLSGGIVSQHGSFQITPVEGPVHMVTRLTDAALPAVLPPLPARGERVTDLDDSANLNLLVVYTAKAESDIGGRAAMHGLVQQAVSRANSALLASGSRRALNLVESARVDYDESSDLRSDLERLRGDADGFLDDVHYLLRDVHGADLVHLIVSDDVPSACGIAYRGAGVAVDFGDAGYSASELDCVGVTDSFESVLGMNLNDAATPTADDDRPPIARHGEPDAIIPLGDELGYRWTHDPDASWYYLAIEEAGSVARQWFKASAVCAGDVCDAGSADPDTNRHQWAVRGWNENGSGPWSEPSAIGRDEQGREVTPRSIWLARDSETLPVESAAANDGSTVAPSDDEAIKLSAAILTDSNVHFPPNYRTMTPPPAGSSYVEPVFGTTVTRLTDGTGLSYGGYVPEYSQHSAFNLDDSYIILLAGTSTLSLHDGNGNLIRSLNEIPGVNAEPRWSRVNRNWVYYHTSNQVRRLDVSSGQVTTIGSFSGSITFGNGQGDISDNERIVIIRSGRYVSIFDLTTGNQFTELDTNQSPINGRSFDNATVSADGNRFIIGFDSRGSGRGTGVELFNADGSFMGQLLNTQGHAAMGRDVNGAQVLYMTNPATLPVQPANCFNGIVKLSLDGNSTRTCLMTMDWIISKHLSANGNDGWVYISTYNEDAQPVTGGPADPTKWYAYTNEIFRVRADGSVVERLAHHRSSIDTYWLQPHATIGISGNKVIWGSDFWMNEQSEYGDTYMIAVNGGGGGGGGGPIAPAAPSGMTATVVSATRVNLAWNDNSDNENSFKLQRRQPQGTWTTLEWPTQNATSYADTGVPAGDWCYRIRSHSSDDLFSAYVNSTPACVTVSGSGGGGPAAPAAPSNLSATAISSNRIDLSWSDNSDNETSFRLQRSVAGGPWSTASWLEADSTSYSDAGLPPGSWCYRINAYNTASASSAFATSSCVDLGGGAAPEPSNPTNLSLTAMSASRIDVAWNDSSSNETSFRLQRRLAGGSWSTASWLPANTTSFSDTGLPSGNWCYRISAWNTADYKSSEVGSSPSCMTIGSGGPAAPADPSNFQASVSGSDLTLSWQSNSSFVTSFKIQGTPQGEDEWASIWVPGNQTTHTISPPAGTYCFRIMAYAYDEHSDYVYSSCVTIGTTPPWWCWWCTGSVESVTSPLRVDDEAGLGTVIEQRAVAALRPATGSRRVVSRHSAIATDRGRRPGAVTRRVT